MHCHLLDQDFHTPALVCSRSPFLLTSSMLLIPYFFGSWFSRGTVVCAIASKFYTHRPELHSQLAELAQKLAFSVPAQGYKSLEIVQAYLLLTLWGCGAVERYEYDKTWLLLGMAIRSVHLSFVTLPTLPDSAFEGWPPTSICTARRQ